jgi:hypothetical protein
MDRNQMPLATCRWRQCGQGWERETLNSDRERLIGNTTGDTQHTFEGPRKISRPHSACTLRMAKRTTTGFHRLPCICWVSCFASHSRLSVARMDIEVGPLTAVDWLLALPHETGGSCLGGYRRSPGSIMSRLYETPPLRKAEVSSSTRSPSRPVPKTYRSGRTRAASASPSHLSMVPSSFRSMPSLTGWT